MDKKVKYPRVNFRINYCSNQDPEYPSSELLLQSPECKGWQTSRYCQYPQHLIIEFIEPIRLRQISLLSHQHKISTRVELHQRLDKDRDFSRIGHFSLHNNQQAGFAARQLKTVPLDIPCLSVKFVFHKNHVNKYNVFNQIGIISVSFFGEKIVSTTIEPERAMNNTIQNPGVVPNQYDKNTVKKLRELEMAKIQAVEREDYALAKHYKEQIEDLKRLGAVLADLEERKKIAVAREDFDDAKRIQDEIKRIRDSAGGGPNVTMQPSNYNLVPKQPLRKRTVDHEQEPSISPKTNINPGNQVRAPPPAQLKPRQEEPQQRQLPAVQQGAKKPAVSHDEKPVGKSNKPQNQNPYGEDAPVGKGQKMPNNFAEDEYPQQQDQGKNAKQLEPLKPDQRKIADQYDDVFSEEVFQKLFSKSFAHRESGLDEVKNVVQNPPAGLDKQRIIASCLAIVKLTIDDKNANIVISSLDLLEGILSKFKPNKQDSSGNMDYILSRLSDHQGHTNEKVKMAAYQLFETLPRYGMTNKNVCLRSLITLDSKKVVPPKIAVGRLEMLKRIVEEFKAGNNLEVCAQFAIKFVDDKNNDTRAAAMSALKALIDEAGYAAISPMLKNVRPAILKSIEAMVEEDREMESMREKVGPGNKQKPPVNEYDDAPLPTSKNKQQAPPPQQQQSKKLLQEPQQNNMKNPEYYCDFCEKYDPQFINENYRDIHLFNNCPMLVLCECQQAIEVSGYTSHLLSECKNSKYYKKCPRCKEAVHQRNYKGHAEAKECLPAKPLAAGNRCPLCHEDIDYGVQGWKKHLVTQGCPNSNRG